MGAFFDYLVSRKYKRWKPHLLGIDQQTQQPYYEPSEISPRATDKIEKPWALLQIKVVRNPGQPSQQEWLWYVYLYDFVKYGKQIKKKQYIQSKNASITNANPYYDPGLDDKLGGTKERLGG